MRASLSLLPSEALGVFCEVARALAVGVAAVWLSSTYLGSRLRFFASMKVFATLAGFSLITYVTTQDWVGTGGQEYAGLICLPIFALVFVTALSLAGLCCRRRFRPARMLIWLLGWLAAGFIVIIVPFALMASSQGSGEIWSVLGGSVLVSTAVSFAILLPFLIVSFTSRFYRERFSQLLQLELPTPPPQIATEPAPIATS